MIHGKCSNWEIYSKLAPEVLREIFKFIKTVTMETENKRYDICGNDVYALVQEYQARPLDECKVEAHRKYIDIQVIISGEENIGIVKLNSLKEICTYDHEKDFSLFEPCFPDLSLIKLSAGDFMILFPDDGHMPGIACSENPSNVKKVVIKLSCEKFRSE